MAALDERGRSEGHLKAQLEKQFDAEPRSKSGDSDKAQHGLKLPFTPYEICITAYEELQSIMESQYLGHQKCLLPCMRLRFL